MNYQYRTISGAPQGSLIERTWTADDLFHVIEQITDPSMGILAGHGGDELLILVGEVGVS